LTGKLINVQHYVLEDHDPNGLCNEKQVLYGSGKKELTDKKNILFSKYRESNTKNTVAHKAHSLPCIAWFSSGYCSPSISYACIKSIHNLNTCRSFSIL
jgi:hypothetical protein